MSVEQVIRRLIFFRLRALCFRLLCVVACVAIASGCLHRRELKPGRTQLTSRLIVVPAQLVGNHFIIEVKWDKHGPWRFLVDTGSSVTLVSSEFARHYATSRAALGAPAVRVRSAAGRSTMLTAITVKEIILRDATFENVQALIYDCTELSAHLGLKIDGVLGFPLFRDTIMALDYPQSRMVITPAGERPFLPGVTIPFNNVRRTPLIPVKLGNETIIALIDSGNDGPLMLNPVGLKIPYRIKPRPGAVIGTLTGDHTQQLSRLAVPLTLGDYALNDPVADLTDQLSALGGEILRNFSITFDQARNQVTFYRPSLVPIAPAPRRSCGLSFSKTPAYWRVAGVVPGSPAAQAGVQNGDLVARINNESITAWDFARFDILVRQSPAITFTFIKGPTETDRSIDCFDVVP